jgi:membrane associated rhomboid family serine protease
MANYKCSSCGKERWQFFDRQQASKPICRKCAKARAEQALSEIALPLRPILTPILTSLNVLVFLAMGAHGGSSFNPTTHEALIFGANFGPLTLHGQDWRLLTSMFIHFGIIHLAFNMWCLWELGSLAERLLGRAAFLAVYLTSGLVGSFASVLWHPMTVSAGASGAIFGVAGSLVSFLYLKESRLGLSPFKKKLGSLVAFVLYNLLNGVTHRGIDNVAHLGGLVVGLSSGALLPSLTAAVQVTGTQIMQAVRTYRGFLRLAAKDASSWHQTALRVTMERPVADGRDAPLPEATLPRRALKALYDLPLWQQWVLVSAVAGSVVASLPIRVAGGDIADGVAFAVTFVGQFVVLRRVIRRASRWLWVSLVGGFLATIVGIVPARRVQDTIDGIKSSPLGLAGIGPGRSALGYFAGAVIVGVGFGAGLGLAQWLLLRWRFVQADWWILANASGFAVGMVLQGFLGKTFPLFAVTGVTTALTLNWLLAKPPPEGPGTFRRPLGVLILAVSAFLFPAVVVAGGMVRTLVNPGGAGASPGVAAWAFWVSVILGVPSTALGIGLLKKRNWARVTILVLAASNLLGMVMKSASVPGGFAVCWTAFHILMIWYLCRPRVVGFFRVVQSPESIVRHA